MGPTLIIWYDSCSDIDSDIYSDICGSLSPVPMVSEWQEAIRSNTLLTPILHYGTSFFDRRAWDKINSARNYPWRHVIITTKETLSKRWDRADYRGQMFWGTGQFTLERLVLDEAHRFRTAGAFHGPTLNPQTGVVT